MIDPIVRVYQTTPGTTELELVGKSEAIFDDLNPEWVYVFWVEHKKGTSQVSPYFTIHTIFI